MTTGKVGTTSPTFLKRATFLVALFVCLALPSCGGNKQVPVQPGGYISEFDLTHMFNLAVFPDLATGAFHFTGESSLTVLVGSSRVVLNGKKLELRSPVVLRDGALLVPVEIVSRLEDENRSKAVYTYAERTFSYSPPEVTWSREPRPSATQSKRPAVAGFVVLDPGHGGSDPGAIGPNTGVTEAELNLLLATEVKALLTAQGIRVAMTRDSNVTRSLSDRVQYANRLGADAFVSIHYNSASDRSVKGFEVFYSSGNRGGYTRLAKSQSLGKAIAAGLDGKWSTRNRGVKDKSLYVTRLTSIPSVLVEIEFVTSREMEPLLRSEWHRKKAAEGVAEGIAGWLGVN